MEMADTGISLHLHSRSRAASGSLGQPAQVVDTERNVRDDPHGPLRERVTRRRAGTSKSRTGCKTCKLRRVKCDEGKPSCARCLQAHRTCGGYEIFAFHSQHPLQSESLEALSTLQAMSLVRPPSSSLAASLRPQDRAAFDFYLNNLALQYDRTFHCTLWCEQVLQMSEQVPALRHAVLSLSAAHQAYLLLGQRAEQAAISKRSMQRSTPHQLALAHHGRALRHLQSLIEDHGETCRHSQQTVEAVVLTCLLFTSYSLLQGDRHYAVFHFKTGSEILQRYQHPNLLRPSNPSSDPNLQTMHALENLYRQLDEGAVGPFRVQPLPAWSGGHLSLDMADPFEDISDARFHLDLLLTSIYQIRDELFRRAAPAATSSETLSSGDHHGRTALLRYLQARTVLKSYIWEFEDGLNLLNGLLERWARNFVPFHLSERTMESEMQEVIQLHIRAFYARLLSANLYDSHGFAGDHFAADFVFILDLALKYMAVGPGRHSPVEERSVAGLEILTAVYIVGIHCREPDVRRRAVDILCRAAQVKYADGNGPRRLLLAACVDRVVKLEEARAVTIRNHEGDTDDARLAEAIPKEARFSDVRIVNCTDEQGLMRGLVLYGRICADGTIDIAEESLVDVLSHFAANNGLEAVA